VSRLLDAILGNFNSGDSGSGNLPPSQAPELAADPYGNPVGGLTRGVPLPRSRPIEGGPPAAAPPDMQPGESGGSGFNPGGGLATALGLDPVRTKTVMASLAGAGRSHQHHNDPVKIQR
jgi:hypothetical protein